MSALLEGELYAGLSGIQLCDDSIDLGDGIILRKVYAHVFAPLMVAVKPASLGEHHPGPWRAASGGFSFDVTAELVIPFTFEVANHDSMLSVSRTLIFLLRLWVNPAITLPLFSSGSFDTLARFDDAHAALLSNEVQRRYFPLGVTDQAVSLGAITWVRDHWKVTHKLLKSSPEFALAVDAIDSGQFIENNALTLVSLWGALEALFSPSTSELRFRVSALIASFLEEPGINRFQRQKEVAKLYDKRSAAAHGAPKHDSKDLLQTFNLLRNVLIKIIQTGSAPDKSKLEEALFGVVDS